MNNLGKKLLITLFLLFIYGIGAALVVIDDKPSSYYENRVLAQKPAITFEGIKDGTFSSSYDSYIIDQFPLRNGWVLSHILIQKLTNQTFILDYYETDDHYVLAKPLSYFATDNINESMKEMNELGELTGKKGIELYFFNLPSRIITLEEMYPDFIEDGYTDDSQKYLFDGITNTHVKKFDFTSLWKKKYSIDELKQLYYQTDHHWNAEGALAGYEIIHNELNGTKNEFNKDNYTKVLADNSTTFLGSYNLQLFATVKDHKDIPSHYISKNTQGSDFEIYVGAKELGGLINFENIFGTKMNLTNNRITYADVFMQDYARLDVINKVSTNDQKALVIKDSFANTLNFLVAENFKETTIIDVRYYTEQSIYDLIESSDFDKVMILYNGETFFNSMYNFNWNN